jgi:hypothetical protein
MESASPCVVMIVLPFAVLVPSRLQEPAAPNGEDENEATAPRSRGRLATACQLCWHEEIQRAIRCPAAAGRARQRRDDGAE